MNGKITYRQQYTRCGKQRCRKCKEGPGHGPYWYAYWSENGRTVSKYIGISAPSEVETGKQTQPAEFRQAGEAGSSTTPLSPPRTLQRTGAREGKKNHPKAQSEAAYVPSLLRVYLLGQFRVERKEGNAWQVVENRTWQRRRARALLGCLLSQTGRRMGREQAMEALWPDLDIETAANRLNGAVHELRQILEPGIERPASSKLLRLERDILTLADLSSIWVDAEAFETLLNRANASTDPEQIEHLLADALAIYGGDYLLEELYSEWAAARRESLRRGWMGLLLRLAEVRAERGALASAIEPLDRLLAADPTHETGVRRLMVLLTQLDRRGEAIRAYEHLAGILKRDYESEPLPETVEFYKDLRQGMGQVARTPGTTDASPPTRDEMHRSESVAAQRSPTPLVSWPHTPYQTLSSGRQNQSPLVGREHELAVMQELLLTINTLSPQESRKTGAPQTRGLQAHLAIIMGETGIGKTRLAEEVSQEAHALGWRVVWTRAYEQESTIPYRPWTDILRVLLHTLPLDQLIGLFEGKVGQTGGKAFGALNPAATAQAKLARLSSLLPELVTTQTLQLQPGRPVAPEQERFHLWETVLSLLNALSQSTPLLLVLDDLHWTDDSSLELLAYLARHQQNERVMLIGTCRDSELAPSASLRSLLRDLSREGTLTTFPLEPLTQAQIARLLKHLPHTYVRSIQSQACGNPLFAEELARFSETLGGEQTRERSSSGGKRSTALPETIAAVLERRLYKLSESCQALLSRATVLGGAFEFRLLMRVTGATANEEERSLDLLEEALNAGLLTEEVSGTRIVYHFWHPLIVSHLYDRLSAARRAQLHQRTAQTLIELNNGNEPQEAAAIAHHLDKYGQDKQNLAYYAERAGNQALALSAHPEALHHYRQALEALQALEATAPATEKDPMHLANLLECMAECNAAQGHYTEAQQQYVQVLALHQAQQKDPGMFLSSAAFLAWQHEEAQIQGMIWHAIGRSWKNSSHYSKAHECAEAGKQVLSLAGITTGAAWACLQNLAGSAYWVEGHFAEAKRHVEDALAIHEEIMRTNQEREEGKRAHKAHVSALPLMHSRRVLLGDPLDLAQAHGTLGVIAASTGCYSESLHHLHTALAILEKHDLLSMMSQVYGNLGAVYSMKGEHPTATTYFQRALDLAERTGDIPSKGLATGNLGEIAAQNGNLHEAVTWLTESLSLADQISNREQSIWAWVMLAVVQQDLGNLREALENLRRALAHARSIKNTGRVGFALVALADWRLTYALLLNNQGGDAEQEARVQRLLSAAQAAVERALALEGIDTETQCIGHIVLTTVYYQMGRLSCAQHMAIKALENARQSEIVHLIARSQQLLGEIQAANNLEQEAEAAFAEALQMCKQCGLRLEYARTLQCYGNYLIAQSLYAQVGNASPTPGSGPRYSTGLDCLREARDIFETCQASLDLQAVERILADPSLLSTPR